MLKSPNRVKPTQFQGQIGPLFGTDFYLMELYGISILILSAQFFLKEAYMYVLLPVSSLEAILSQS